MARAVQEVDQSVEPNDHFDSKLYARIREETYDMDMGQRGWLTAEEQDLFLSWLELNDKRQVLDVGCGSGGPALRIASLIGCRVDGVDIREDRIRSARRAASKGGLTDNTDFRTADTSAFLASNDSVFDAVMCVDAINHFEDRSFVFSEWYRILKPGGRLVFTDPAVVTGPISSEELCSQVSNDFSVFVPDGCNERLLEKTGFVIRYRRDRTDNMAGTAVQWRKVRERYESELRLMEGDDLYEERQASLELCARLADEGRLSRIAFCALKG